MGWWVGRWVAGGVSWCVPGRLVGTTSTNTNHHQHFHYIWYAMRVSTKTLAWWMGWCGRRGVREQASIDPGHVEIGLV